MVKQNRVVFVGGKGENRTHTSGFADRLTTTVDLPIYCVFGLFAL